LPVVRESAWCVCEYGMLLLGYGQHGSYTGERGLANVGLLRILQCGCNLVYLDLRRGAIGPLRFFSVYRSTLYCFLIGLVLPFVPWLLDKRYPHPYWRLIHIPLIASFTGPGRFQNFYIMPLVSAFLFQYYAFKHHHGKNTLIKPGGKSITTY
jgi:hypothetical protein